MRRSLGAETVKLDARDGTATCTLATPREIDLPGLERAVHGAGYTLKRVEIAAEGRIVAAGESGAVGSSAAGHAFELPGTEQRFPIRGKAPPQGAIRIRGNLSGWGGEGPALEVTAGSPR